MSELQCVDRKMNTDIVRQLRLRLSDCGGHLCSFYAQQVLLTGRHTTAEDAFGAWGRWLSAEGGGADNPFKIGDWPSGFHERIALVIREVSRYVEPFKQ